MTEMPDLITLPPRSVVFVDTNIFDLQYRGKSVSCDVFIRRIALGEVTAYVNTQVLSDLLHKLMLAEACTKGLVAIRSAQKLKLCLQVNRALAAQLTDYQRQFENTLSIGLKVLRITKQLLVDTKIERANHGLLTGDSIHLGNMNRHNQPVRDIVTYDGDFAHVPGLTVWEPMDVIP